MIQKKKNLNDTLQWSKLLRIQGKYNTEVSAPAKILTFVLWIAGSAGCATAFVYPHISLPLRIAMALVSAASISLASICINRSSVLALRIQHVLDTPNREKKIVMDREWRQAKTDEMTVWCKNVFSSFAEYPIYWDKAKLSEEEALRADIEDAIPKLSMGFLKADHNAYIIPEFFTDQNAKTQWKTICKREREQAEAIAKIWSHVISPAKIPAEAWCKRARRIHWLRKKDTRIEALGYRLGIDEMMRAYAEGVPLEDILI